MAVLIWFASRSLGTGSIPDLVAVRRRGCFVVKVVGQDGGHIPADDEPWFDASWDAIEAACPGTHRSQRDIDWSDGLARSGLFLLSERFVVPWVRRITVQQGLTDTRSHSFVAALAPDDRDRLLDVFAHLTADAFPDGEMSVPYETWLWIATKA